MISCLKAILLQNIERFYMRIGPNFSKLLAFNLLLPNNFYFVNILLGTISINSCGKARFRSLFITTFSLIQVLMEIKY